MRRGWTPPLDDTEIASWQRLLEQQMPVVTLRDRQGVLGARQRSRTQALRLGSYWNYCDYRDSGRNVWCEWQRRMDGLTVNDMTFLSNKVSLVVVINMHLPNRLKENEEGAGVSAWSLGRASDQEADTLATLIDGQYTAMDDAASLGVTAIDISAGVLNTERRRCCHNRHSRRMHPRCQQTYCNILYPEQMDMVGTSKRRACFVQFSALDIECFPMEDVDMSFCQNMVIYIARPQRLRVLNTLAERLCRGGLHVLGASDVSTWSHRDLRRIGRPGTLAYLRELPCSETAREQA